MARYRTYERKSPRRTTEPHPIWRGIGCFIMLVVPVFSYGISAILVQNAPSMGVQLPVELVGHPVMPEILFKVPGLVGILNWIEGIDNLYAILVGAVTIMILLSGFLALVYALVYRIVGPPRESEVDVSMPNIKVKKYRR